MVTLLRLSKASLLVPVSPAIRQLRAKSALLRFSTRKAKAVAAVKAVSREEAGDNRRTPLADLASSTLSIEVAN